MFEISRLWDISDFDLEPHVEILYKRPRINYRISEYVFNYINKNILEPQKIMQTGNYDICLTMNYYYKDKQKYFEDSPYNSDKTKYDSSISNITEDGIKSKIINILCYSIEFNENIKPKEYANIVYDMIGAFLIKKYKKITKEIMDKNKKAMDYKTLEKYKYPALFKEQKYLLDDDISEGINIKKEYKKYYRE